MTKYVSIQPAWFGPLQSQIESREHQQTAHNRVRILAILHDIDQVLEQPASFGVASSRSDCQTAFLTAVLGDATFAKQDGGSQVAEQVRSIRRNGLFVPFTAKEFDELFESTLGVFIPVHKETPMEEPCALLECLEGIHCSSRNHGFHSSTDGIDAYSGSLPILV